MFFFATFSQFNILYDYILFSSYLLFAVCLVHKENDPIWALKWVVSLYSRTPLCVWIYTIYPLFQCQSSSGSLVRASDWNSEDPGSNLGWISMPFSSVWTSWSSRSSYVHDGQRVVINRFVIIAYPGLAWSQSENEQKKQMNAVLTCLIVSEMWSKGLWYLFWDFSTEWSWGCPN